MHSITNNPKVNQPNFAKLDTDFGDAPLGKLGNRALQVGEASRARAGQPSVGKKIESFFRRGLSVFSGPKVRAEGKFRRGLESLSRGCGNALGALTQNNGGADKQKFLRELKDLPRRAAPVTSRGVDFRAALQKRLAVHCDKLDTPSLTALSRELNKMLVGDWQKTDADDEVLISLADTDKAVRKAVTARLRADADAAIGDTLQRALAKAPNERARPGQFAFEFDFAWAKVDKVVTAMVDSKLWASTERSLRDGVIKGLSDSVSKGESEISDGVIKGLSNGLIKGLIGQMPTDQCETILEHVSSSKLQAMQDAVSLLHDATDIDTAIQNEISGRGARLLNSITAQTKAIKADVQGTVPKDFVRRLGELQHDIELATKHAKTFNNSNTELLDAAVASMSFELNEKLSPGKIDFGTLDNREVAQLHSALKQFAVEGLDPKSEITARENAAMRPCNDAFDRLMSGLGNGDVSAFLDAQTQYLDAVDKVLQTYRELGQHIDGPDEVSVFIADMMEEQLGRNGVDLDRAYKALNGDDFGPMREGMFNIGSDLLLLEGEHNEQRGMQLLHSSNNMKSLNESIIKALGKEPAASYQHAAPETQLRDAARAALRSAAGVDIGADGKFTLAAGIGSGTANADFAAQFETNASRALEDPTVRKRDANKLPVCEQFTRDFRRNGSIADNYTIVANGTREDMLSPNRRVQPEQIAAAGAERLTEFCNGNEEEAFALSQWLNQSIMAGFLSGLNDPATNPCTDSEGQAVTVMAWRNGKSNFTLSRDEDGSVRIGLSYGGQPEIVMDHAGKQHVLDARSSLSLNTEVVLPPDSEPQFGPKFGPIDYRYSLFID
ncbi:MAG: hypothetical protein MJA83_14590 [Gammaproteobacteria bacterium]|nr:hypothetical protein [Gammaproteobacteria bacterium]